MKPCFTPQSTAWVRLPAPIFRIVLALRDEGQNLGLAVTEPLAPTRPVESDGAAGSLRGIADNRLTGVHGFQGSYQLTCGQGFRQVAVGPALSMRSG